MGSRTTSSFAYPVDLKQAEDGRFVARLPDLVGAVTDGNNRAEALREASAALEEAIAACMASHEDIPRPSPARGRPCVAPGVLIAAKVALYEAKREVGIGNVELGRRLGVAENEIRRCLDPRHATKINRLEDALATLGRRLIVTMDAA